MSMLAIARDTAALFELSKELERVRELQLRAAREGRRAEASEIREAELRAVDQIRRKFYCRMTRLGFMPEAQADAVTDQQDYERRLHVDSEVCVVEGHRRILAVPCVGNPEHDDPELDDRESSTRVEQR